MTKLIVFGVLLLASTACTTTNYALIQPGSYVTDAGARVVFEDGPSATLVQPDGSSQELELTEVPREEWFGGCRTGGGSPIGAGSITLMQTFQLGDVQIGEMTVPDAYLVAPCYSSDLAIAGRGYDPECKFGQDCARFRKQ